MSANNELPARKFPAEFSTLVPAPEDEIIVSDNSDPDNSLWKATVQSILTQWSSTLTTDNIAEWTNNLYYTTQRAQDDNKDDYTPINTNTTVTDQDHLVTYAVDTSSSTITITLPSAALVWEGFNVNFLKTDPSNQVTVNPDWSDTISEGANLVILTDNDFRSIKSDGVSNWYVSSSVISTSWDVTWPWSSIDDNLVSFNGITGKIIKDSWISVISSDTFTWATSSNINTATETKNYVDNTFNTEATDISLWTVQRATTAEIETGTDATKYISVQQATQFIRNVDVIVTNFIVDGSNLLDIVIPHDLWVIPTKAVVSMYYNWIALWTPILFSESSWGRSGRSWNENSCIYRSNDDATTFSIWSEPQLFYYEQPSSPFRNWWWSITSVSTTDITITPSANNTVTSAIFFLHITLFA